MVTKTITEQRAEVHIFAGNDPAHTATGSSGISSATPALTPLMLDGATGNSILQPEDLREPAANMSQRGLFTVVNLSSQRRQPAGLAWGISTG